MDKKVIFTVNCGSTSTKVALFHDEELIIKKDVSVDIESIRHMKKVAEQLDIREATIQEFLKEAKIDPAQFDIIVARGGALPTMTQSAYMVNDFMLDVLNYAPPVQHASSLSCLLGLKLAEPHGTPVIIYDATAVDQVDPIAKLTGCPDIERNPVSHVLNTRKVAREVADQMGKPYEECRFIVAHLGGGISVNAHRDGRIVDFVCHDEYHMSPQRTGGFRLVPLLEYLRLGKQTLEEFLTYSQSKGGLLAYLGVQDAREVEKMIADGDEKAKEVYEAMAYQVAKSIGMLAPVLCGQVDRVILTGGMAHSTMFTGWLKERISYLAPVELVPGEKEMEALALGGLRVLRGEEKAYDFDILPKGYSSREELYNQK